MEWESRPDGRVLCSGAADLGRCRSQVGLTDTDGWRSHCFSSILGGTRSDVPPMRPGALRVGGRWVMSSTTCVFPRLRRRPRASPRPGLQDGRSLLPLVVSPPFREVSLANLLAEQVPDLPVRWRRCCAWVQIGGDSVSTTIDLDGSRDEAIAARAADLVSQQVRERGLKWDGASGTWAPPT